MDKFSLMAQRRLVLAGLAATFATLPLAGTARAGGLTDILADASDAALDRLARPGAFYDDPDIRIGLPLVGSLGGLGGLGDLGGLVGGNSGLLKVGKKLGLFGGITRKLNDAAGVAAGEAKPIFRVAIADLSLRDVPGIIKHKDGGSHYLRTSAGDELHGKLRPLVDKALGDLGAFTELDNLTKTNSLLASAGLGRDGLGKSVTDQALDGIFQYIGHEEARLRADPLGKAGKLLKGVLGN